MDLQQIITRAREALAVRKLKDVGLLDPILEYLDTQDRDLTSCPPEGCLDWAIRKVWSDGVQHARVDLRAWFVQRLQITSLSFTEILDRMRAEDGSVSALEDGLRRCRDRGTPVATETLVAAMLLELEEFPPRERSGWATLLEDGHLDKVFEEISQRQGELLLSTSVRQAVHREVEERLEDPFETRTRLMVHETIARDGKEQCRREINRVLDDYGRMICRFSMPRLIWKDVALSLEERFYPSSAEP